ncbi:hypothetical protein [Ornithinibacillus gellani]|nr:hypothetical protein [Ornithinibacillus gellani]
MGAHFLFNGAGKAQFGIIEVFNDTIEDMNHSDEDAGYIRLDEQS